MIRFACSGLLIALMSGWWLPATAAELEQSTGEAAERLVVVGTEHLNGPIRPDPGGSILGDSVNCDSGGKVSDQSRPLLLASITSQTSQTSRALRTSRSCRSCSNNEICADGRCLNIDRIERASGTNFDRACSATRCSEGEICVAGRCYQPTRASVASSGTNNCLEVDCGPYKACYVGICYATVDENLEPAECAVNPPADSEQFSFYRCEPGQVCRQQVCHTLVPREVVDQVTRLPIPRCGSGQASLPGVCLDVTAVEQGCRGCGHGELCLGGQCVEPTPRLGEPCRNSRCPGDSSCLSGLCVNNRLLGVRPASRPLGSLGNL